MTPVGSALKFDSCAEVELSFSSSETLPKACYRRKLELDKINIVQQNVTLHRDLQRCHSSEHIHNTSTKILAYSEDITNIQTVYDA
jgi:hypothetical protein